jgi:anion-transporting  ArsA/GET3 family ATPase
VKASPKIEFFIGTGGVGKTTLAASRALYLAKRHRTLLITIDPSKRLKDFFSLSEEGVGSIQSFIPQGEEELKGLDLLIFNPASTFARMLKESQEEIRPNNIISILTRPFGGMSEIFSLIEIEMQRNSGDYDWIIIDTPPGIHFLDFLNSHQKIAGFFDHSFIELFSLLNPAKITKSSSFKPWSRVIKSGLDKLLRYLESVTGKDFVQNFLITIQSFHILKDYFLSAIDLKEVLADSKQSNYRLVLAAGQPKIKESTKLVDRIKDLRNYPPDIIINKSLFDPLNEWQPEKNTIYDSLRLKMINQEQKMNEFAKNNAYSTFIFKDCSELLLQDQLKYLTEEWKKYD